jgi:hypothetical protein
VIPIHIFNFKRNLKMRLPKQSVGINRGTSQTTESQPHQINIPGFVNEEIGLGDVIKKITTRVGFKPCGGCQRRAAALNQWLVFSPQRRK